jgi:hypothetical protein
MPSDSGTTIMQDDGSVTLDEDGNELVSAGDSDCDCCGCACVPASELADAYTVTLQSNFVAQPGCWDGEPCDNSSLITVVILAFDCAVNNNTGQTLFEVMDVSGDTLCLGGFFVYDIQLLGTSCGWTISFNVRDADGSTGGMEVIYSQQTPSSDPIGVYDLSLGLSAPYCDGAAPATVTVT